MRRWPWLRVTIAISSPAAAQDAGMTAITDVTVIDGSSPTPRSGQTVLVQGNRIVTVAPTAAIQFPAGTRQVSGAGKFLIPGLWDMHVHTVVPAGRRLLSLYVANGVLGVRDLAGVWDSLVSWRREIRAGTLVGPRLILSGPYIEGGDVPIPHLLARTPAEARSAVDSLARLGVDLIKLHSQLSREVYLAAASAARARGIRVAGHVPRTVGVEEASDSGVGSIEHMLQLPLPCTPAESASLVPRFPVQRVLGECTSRDQAPTYARLVRNGTWLVPTLVAAVEIARWPRRELPGDAFARHLPDTLRRFVLAIFPMPEGIPSDAHVTGQALFDKRVALVGVLHRAGVGILPGTDAPLRNSPPGFGLHEELALLARGGMPPHAVLKAATLDPARYLGLTDSLGIIAEGQLAELVLLRENPLADIRNTRTIEGVMSNGRWYDRGRLDRLIGSVPGH